MRLGLMAAATALVVAGCGNGDDGGGDTGDDAGGGAETGGTITIGAVPGWNDQTGTAYLYKSVLEEHGYTVEVTEFSDNAPIYTGVAQGDIDVFGSAWPERTQASYWDEYGDSLEDIGVFNETASLFLAVPEYSDITSIDELPDYADELDGQIIGIEAGAGLSDVTENDVMPAYGLDGDFELVLSSTAAMLAELESSMNDEEEIVVTLWTPFWANLAYDVRPLEDPEGAFGEPEGMHTLAREGFTEDFPEVAEMMSNFTLTDEQLASMEDTMVNEFDDDDEAAVEAWLEDNPDLVEEMAQHLGG